MEGDRISPSVGARTLSVFALSPTAVFGILVGLAAAAVAATVLLLGGDGSQRAPSNARQAIDASDIRAEFRDLNNLRLRAYRTRDVSLLSDVFAPGSAGFDRAHSEITKLRRTDVVPDVSEDILRLKIASSKANRTVIVEKARISVKFVTETGKDVTEGSSVRLQRVRWLLHRTSVGWRIVTGKVETSSSLGR